LLDDQSYNIPTILATAFLKAFFCVLSRYVIGTDASNTLISDLRAFLDECQRHNIFMILVLFNGAVLRNQGGAQKRRCQHNGAKRLKDIYMHFMLIS
jgi:hypothetical protein